MSSYYYDYLNHKFKPYPAVYPVKKKNKQYTLFWMNENIKGAINVPYPICVYVKNKLIVAGSHDERYFKIKEVL